jgi:hypothetical protein
VSRVYDPAEALAGAVRAEQAADDWRTQLRADVAMAREVDELGPACICPDQRGWCRDDCDHCTALPDEDPCPADVDADVDAGEDTASWTPPDSLPATPDVRPDVIDSQPAGAVAGDEVPDEDGVAHDAVIGSRQQVSGPGWRSRHDPASRAFGVVDRLAGKAALRDVALPAGAVLDQGREGACVGFGVADAVNVLRLIAGAGDQLDAGDALGLYREAQKLDDVPGEDYSGTSVLAGMKAGQADGFFGGYLWDFGTSAIAQTLLQLRSPVVVGVPWWQAMYETGPGGLVVGVGGGKLAGGHCLCIIGLRMKGPQGQSGPYFVWRNSWGESYGDAGNGYVHHRDLAALLHSQGEAAVPTAGRQKGAG